MQRNTLFRRGLLASALALAVAPAFAADTYSKTVFFGDSLTDAGFFRPLLPADVRPFIGQFTTNPGFVWSQYLADFYGTDASANGNGQNGDNYAVGGARVGVNTSGALGPIPSMTSQLAGYLAANGGKADPNALYTVWGGANDLFTVTNDGANPATVIGGAVAAEVGMVAQLQAAGAKYVMVAAVPDLGATPAFRAQGAAAQAAGTALATNYNNALFSGLAGAGLQVIPLDTFGLLGEIIASPATYGFSNYTGTACQPQITANSLTCSPGSYVSPDAPNTYIFADGVHPTGRAHQIMAEYAVSVLEGPRQIAALPHAARASGNGRALQVAEHRIGAGGGDGTYWWGGLRADMQRYGHGELYDGASVGGLFGVDKVAGAWTFGGFAGVGGGKLDFGASSGNFRQQEATLGGFVGWNGERAWFNGQLSYTRLDYKVHRDVALGPATRRHSGSPDGSNVGVGLGAGYQFGTGALKHGPVLSLVAQRIDVDGYAEDNPASTALAFPDQSLDSLVGSIGWQASYPLSERVQPYMRLSWNREFEDAPAQAFATLQSIPAVGQFAVPGLALDEDYGRARIGVRAQVFGLQADAGVDAVAERKGGRDASVYVTLGAKF